VLEEIGLVSHSNDKNDPWVHSKSRQRYIWSRFWDCSHSEIGREVHKNRGNSIFRSTNFQFCTSRNSITYQNLPLLRCHQGSELQLRLPFADWAYAAQGGILIFVVTTFRLIVQSFSRVEIRSADRQCCIPIRLKCIWRPFRCTHIHDRCTQKHAGIIHDPKWRMFFHVHRTSTPTRCSKCVPKPEVIRTVPQLLSFLKSARLNFDWSLEKVMKSDLSDRQFVSNRDNQFWLNLRKSYQQLGELDFSSK
jgi:hypothetical protein